MKTNWLCPFCDREFEWFEVLDTEEHRRQSLAPHLYLAHETDLKNKALARWRKVI